MQMVTSRCRMADLLVSFQLSPVNKPSGLFCVSKLKCIDKTKSRLMCTLGMFIESLTLLIWRKYCLLKELRDVCPTTHFLN